ncbi:TRIM2_3 [Mytilus coruscus]|uniref:TRIM2_3 n=1 Tax=Mytilus coruscus TaxID=42192 RepID=A0A6J8D932_MYTCO|nr:TRIM2_3 [Mytilus coruscus]
MASAIQLPCCGPCGYDDITKEARRWCTNCKEGLCEDCQKAHIKNKTSRNHKVISIDDYRKIENVSISEVCDYHGEHLEWFCKTHDKALCMLCVTSNHKACSGVIQITAASEVFRQSTAFSDLVDSIDVTLNNLKQCITNRQIATKRIEKQELKIKKLIIQTRTNINTHLDKLQEKLLQELGSTSRSCKSEHSKILQKLQSAEERLAKLREQTLHIKQYSSDIQVFLGTYRGNKTIVRETESILDDIWASKDYELKVDINSLIANLLTNVQDYGQIKISENRANIDFGDPKINQAQIETIVPTPRKISNIQLQLIKTFRISMREKNAEMNITGCVMLSNGHLLMVNCAGKSLIEYTNTGEHIRDIPVSGTPFGIAVINPRCIVVSYATANFLAIMNNITFKVEKKIRFKRSARGLSQENGRLYVVSGYASIQVLDLSGRQLETLKIASYSVMNLTTNTDYIFYTDYNSNKVHCCLMSGEELWQFKSESINYPDGIAIDSNHNVLVLGFESNKLIIFQHDGKESKTLLTESDGLDGPSAVYYDKGKRTLLICNQDGTVFLYKVV